MHLLLARLVLACTIVLAPIASSANLPTDPPHQLYSEGDLKLESGEVIHDFSISYVTHGTLNAARDNAILMTSSLGGNHHRVDFLIGAGKAYDPATYFIICTDAIGNGFTTSPSNSAKQHGTAFPRYTLGDMVQSQYRLITEKFGIKKLAIVTGASMGGMQSLQWGVTHPEMMSMIVALTPLARTPPWSMVMTQAGRTALTLDPAYNNGAYTAQPERGWRAQSEIFDSIATRTPAGLDEAFPKETDVLAFMKKQEDNRIATKLDANDWISQTYAYDRFNVGAVKFNGDWKAALGTIKAKTLIMGGPLDLLNPAEEAIRAAQAIPGAVRVTIPSKQGHFAASSFNAADVQFMNGVVGSFISGRTVTPS